MAEVVAGTALKPPGRTDGTSAEPSDRPPTCILVVLHTPSMTGVGVKLDIHSPRFTIGMARDDFVVEGASAFGARAELVWMGDGQAGREGTWVFRGDGRVFVNGEPARDRPLRSGDELRVVNTYFRFLSGSAPQDSYHEAIYHITILHIPSGAHNHRYLVEAFARDRARAARRSSDLSLGVVSVECIGADSDADEGLTRPIVQQLRQASDSWVIASTRPNELVVVAAGSAPALEAELAKQVRSCALTGVQIRIGVAPNAVNGPLEQLLETARTSMALVSG